MLVKGKNVPTLSGQSAQRTGKGEGGGSWSKKPARYYLVDKCQELLRGRLANFFLNQAGSWSWEVPSLGQILRL